MQQGNQESITSPQLYLRLNMKDMALKFSEQRVFHAKTPQKFTARL